MIVIQNAKVRHLLRWLIPCVLIPALVLLGAWGFPAQQHLLVSLGVAVLALGLFLCGFERRQAGARQLVLAAVLTALCIAGRMIPLIKPVTALTILSGMYLGGETGFLVGALAALLSNFSFGQGPWTPFQMLAWGLIGLAAGWLRHPLKQSRVCLLGYGLLSGLAFSLLMDGLTVLWYDGGFRWALYQSALMAALPHTAVYCLSNVLFLWWLARPIGRKLERVRVKYRIADDRLSSLDDAESTKYNRNHQGTVEQKK